MGSEGPELDPCRPTNGQKGARASATAKGNALPLLLWYRGLFYLLTALSMPTGGQSSSTKMGGRLALGGLGLIPKCSAPGHHWQVATLGRKEAAQG